MGSSKKNFLEGVCRNCEAIGGKMIIELLKAKEDTYFGKGVSEKEIKKAEKRLGLHFDSEYREYLSEFGFAIYEGHELTGLSKSERINVVDVTLEERKKGFPKDIYVIEQTGVEGIIIWQSTKGEIFYSSPSCELTEYCKSLSEYISKY